MIEVCEDWYGVDMCRANPDKIYVFGDNLVRRGKGGQALIRDEPNTFGVPTKRAPRMTENSFFADRIDEQQALIEALDELDNLARNGETLVIPAAGLGTGLAEMEKRSPYLFRILQEHLQTLQLVYGVA